MRDDTWIYKNNDRYNNINKNARDLHDIVSKFLSECEDSEKVAQLFLQMSRNSNVFLGRLPPEPTVDSVQAGLLESMPAWIQSGLADRVLAEGVVKYLRGETV